MNTIVLKKWLLTYLPFSMVKVYRWINFKIKNIPVRDSKFAKLSNKEIFSSIYQNNLWGSSGEEDFFSGPGSNDLVISRKYSQALMKHLKDDINNMTVIDLGCGDFKIGSMIYKKAKKYIGIDVVPELIERNKKLFINKNLKFLCLDIVKDELPTADCIMLREVLQHLTNEEVSIILKKLNYFKYLIITESIPIGKFTPNLDKVKGPESREYINSGIVIHKPPFNFKFSKKFEILNVKRPGKDLLITTIYERSK